MVPCQLSQPQMLAYIHLCAGLHAPSAEILISALNDVDRQQKSSSDLVLSRLLGELITNGRL